MHCISPKNLTDNVKAHANIGKCILFMIGTKSKMVAGKVIKTFVDPQIHNIDWISFNFCTLTGKLGVNNWANITNQNII